MIESSGYTNLVSAIVFNAELNNFFTAINERWLMRFHNSSWFVFEQIIRRETELWVKIALFVIYKNRTEICYRIFIFTIF